jgi:hypothetical protein
VLLGIGLIVAGVLFLATSRVFAEVFEVPGDRSAVTQLLGFGDDVGSRYRRWAVFVVIGLACVGGGVAELCS